MANLIRLKQIESSSAIQTAANVGADFSASVTDIVSQSIETTFSASIVQIITNNVGAVLPDGVVSSSTQINLISASGYQELATDLEVSVISSSVSASIAILSSTYITTASFDSVSSSFAENISSSNASILSISSSTNNTIVELSNSVNTNLTALFNTASNHQDRIVAQEFFSTSLDLTYATDEEVYVSQSNINIDMGEW